MRHGKKSMIHKNQRTESPEWCVYITFNRTDLIIGKEKKESKIFFLTNNCIKSDETCAPSGENGRGGEGRRRGRDKENHVMIIIQ